MPNYGSLWPTYAKQWDSMTIRPSRLAEFKSIAKRLFDAKGRYVNVQNKTGVPWYMIAVIHEREASQNWNTQLAQGDPLHRRSTHVPRGMGPYDTWEEGALAALKYDGLTKVQDWRLEKILFHLEQFNGWGYHLHGVPSAYVWAGSTVYTRGKYVADGVWSSGAIDTQPGCAPLIRCLMDLDPTIRPERESAEDVKPIIKSPETVQEQPLGASEKPVDEFKSTPPTSVTPKTSVPSVPLPIPNQDQTLSIVRAVLLATGTILATLGVMANQVWEPISGVILALVPVAWSMIIHRTSNTIERVAAMPDVVKVEVKPTPAGIEAANANSDSLVVVNGEH